MDSSRNAIDVTIKSFSKEFGAHSEIIKVVCPGMLEADVVPSPGERLFVDASAFEDDVVEGLLDYIYKGETRFLKTLRKAAELLKLAKAYGFQELRKKCEAVIWENFQPSPNTILDDLLTAYYAGMEDFKQACLHFWYKNLRAVMNSKSYERHLESNQFHLLFLQLPCQRVRQENES